MPAGPTLTVDATAFEAEVSPHVPALRRMALRFTQDEQAAEDLLQDTLERGFVHFGQYRQGTNARAWLLQIMRNVRISAYRSASRRPAIASLEALDEHAAGLATHSRPQPSSSVESLVVSRLGEAAIVRAIERLPEDFRRAVLLSDIGGYSYKEMAAMLGVPMGTVTSRLHRGRKQLQLMLWNEAHALNSPAGDDRVSGAA